MDDREKGSYCCSKCYRLFEIGELIIRQARPKQPDLFFHPGCTKLKQESAYKDVYIGKANTGKVLAIPEKSFESIRATETKASA